ncbi:MAG: peptidoglycan DD-metalloendopeptidase family protein [Candidatus Lernaella stagnicola]|nr:peptidoglycan DD-metalloendopeptidase family protein [Candidatus Lernaella stagnicola]
MPLQRSVRFCFAVVLIAVVQILAWSGCERTPKEPFQPAPTPTPEPAPTPPPGIPLEGAIQNGQTLSTALAEFQIESPEAERIINALRAVDFPFRKIRPHQSFTVWTTEDGHVTALDFHVDRLRTYQVREDPDQGLIATLHETPTVNRVKNMGGRVETSVYASILAAGESDALASLVSNVFAWDVDFYSDPRVGDSFRLIYEKRFVEDGESIGYGRLLAAEYDGEVTGIKRGYWFETGDELWDGFYDQDGKQLKKTFLVAPLDTMRVTSRYGMRRHPILGRRMMHNGVDYGAPVGTPVWAVADGKVTSAGSAGAAGRMVKISHPGGYVTMYLHLSRIQVRSGQRVRQRQMIGRVGSTGRSTGPHLDFRVKHNGRYINPQRLRMIASPLKVLPEKHQPAFKALIEKMKPQLTRVKIPPAPAKQETNPTPENATEAAPTPATP